MARGPLRLAWVGVLLLAPATASAQACGHHCGSERWAVKTFTDPDTGKVDLTPHPGSVALLRALARPATVTEDRRSLAELRTYRIRALLIGWKHEADDDYHLVVADSAHPDATMIVEIPSGACARVCTSRLLPAMTTARHSIEAALGPGSAHYRTLSPAPMVTITGIVFFDRLHGQTGVAPNGVELHPVIGLAFGPEPHPPLGHDSLLDRLVGDWTMTGTVRGQPVTYDMTGTRVLQGKFVELHMTDTHQPPGYEARVFLGVDSANGEYIAHWLDTFGPRYSIPHATGRASGDTIRLAFAYADGPFRDTFIYHPDPRGWTFHLEDHDSTGTWRPFAVYEVRPAHHH
jgi:hypothetical protein